MSLNLEKYIQQFISEAEEKIASIQNCIVALESNPADMSSIHSIQRDMHTIKGSARMVGLSKISELGHMMEDLMSIIHSKSEKVGEETIKTLFSVIDVLSGFLTDASSGRESEIPENITASIESIKKSASESSVKEAAGKPVQEKKKFRLNFNSFKEKLQVNRQEKKPEKPKENEAKPAAVPQTPVARSFQVKKTEVVVAPHRRRKKTEIKEKVQPRKNFIRVDADSIESIINQITDLLSKNYYFNSVTESYKKFIRINSSLRNEVTNLLRKNPASLSNSQRELLSNMDNTVNLLHKNIQEYDRNFQMNMLNFNNSLRDAYDSLLGLKMTPLDTIFNMYPRFVRDYASRNEKKISLIIRGGDIYLDKNVIEKINEPLIHLIRNSCDHGIESPETRAKNNKPATGEIIIDAKKIGSNVEIIIKDNGSGLDKDKILQKALKSGLIDQNSADHMSDSEAYNLIFEPGFSTRDKVSEISGRGMGMDIVKKTIHQLNGTIKTESKKNRKTVFTLSIPVTSSSSKVIHIVEEDTVYSIPGNQINSIMKIKPDDIRSKNEFSIVIKNETVYTVAKLNQILKGKTRGYTSDTIYMLVPKTTDKKIAILTDNIVMESEEIIKEPDTFLGKQKNISGYIISSRGKIQAVLDMYDIIDSSEFSKKIKIVKPVYNKELQKKRILVVDDSILVREMEKNLLENAGYDVTTAINGFDGYNKALSSGFDLILSDIEMPEMDGFEMIENIRKIEEHAETPVIVLSTVEKEEDKIRGLKTGANAWLQKQDFNDSEIIKVIKSFTG